MASTTTRTRKAPAKKADPVTARQQTKINIDGREVIYENLTPDQQRLFQMVMDLDQKMAKAQLEFDEFAMAKQMAMGRLNGSLGINPEDAQ